MSVSGRGYACHKPGRPIIAQHLVLSIRMYYVTFPVAHVRRDCARKLAESSKSIPRISKIQRIVGIVVVKGQTVFRRNRFRAAKYFFFSLYQVYPFENKSAPSIALENVISCTFAIRIFGFKNETAW